MRVYEAPGTLKRFRRTTWEFQRTFRTPLNDLPRFVDVILSQLPGLQSSLAVFDQVVFEPHYELMPLYEKYAMPLRWYGDDVTIEAEGPAQTRELLEGVLSEWIDFFFVPTPKQFMIYADHDEYITFLAHRKGNLNGVTDTLTAAKFDAVEYVLKF